MTVAEKVHPDDLEAAFAAKSAPRTLTGADRCDLCGAAAYGIVLTPKGPLLFCGHHLNGRRTKFIDLGYPITDETDSILSTDTSYHI